jgi:hypothetical protein
MPKKPATKSAKKTVKSKPVKQKTKKEKTSPVKKVEEEKMAAKFQVEEITDQEEKKEETEGQSLPDFPQEEETASPFSSPTTQENLAQPTPETAYQPPIPPQQDERTGQPQISQYPEKKSPLKTIFVIFLLLLFLGAVIAGAIQVYQKAVKKQEEAKPSPTPTSEETTLPTPGISPDLESTESASPSAQQEEKRKDLKVKVLNGGGVVGAAGKVATALEKLGYEDIRTGNAPNFNYEKSEIIYLETKKEFLSMFENDLKDYEIGAKTSTDSADFDFTFIIGKE